MLLLMASDSGESLSFAGDAWVALVALPFFAGGSENFKKSCLKLQIEVTSVWSGGCAQESDAEFERCRGDDDHWMGCDCCQAHTLRCT